LYINTYDAISKISELGVTLTLTIFVPLLITLYETFNASD